MRVGPKCVTEIILEDHQLDASPRPLVEVITEIVFAKNWETTQATARVKAESWKGKVLTYLQTEISKLEEVGRPSRITFNSSSNYMIQGACFVEPRDSSDVCEKKARRLRSVQYYSTLQNLTANQFEDLGGKLINLLGVQDPQVSRRSADEGIDFYGKLSLESMFFPHDLSPTIQKQLCVWIVGQAKHYTIPVGTHIVRELAGSVLLGRSQTFGSVNSPYPNLNINVGDPVFMVLITTGRFSSNAWWLLKRSGIIGMDGEMIAAFLADREASLSSSGNFDDTAFINWLSSQQFPLPRYSTLIWCIRCNISSIH